MAFGECAIAREGEVTEPDNCAGTDRLGVLPYNIESREPRAESREPRAESREPRAESREPRAESREPRAESREPRAESREPRAESREPRAESREPRAESREPRAESREPRAESRAASAIRRGASCRLSLSRRGAPPRRSSSARSSRGGSPPRTSDTGTDRLCRFAAWRGSGFTAGLARKVRTVVAAAALATVAGLSVLAFPETARAQAPSPSVCDRTPQVRDNIVATAPVSNCADVTSAHLEARTTMELPDAGISSLRAGDFA